MSAVAIIAGIALLLEQTWSIYIFYLAMGLILYALINAIGIYKEKKYKLLVVTLVSSVLITIVLIITSIIILTI